MTTARLTLVVTAAAALLAGSASADGVPPVAGVGTHSTVYGLAFTDPEGMTLYQFDGDPTGKSACDAACARIWRPLAAARLARPKGGDWSVIVRQDGTPQWAFRGKPVYSYAQDMKPGDVNGEGADKGRWRVALSERDFLPPGVTINKTDYGPSFTTADGHTLYMEVNFTYDAAANGTPRHQASPPPSACAGDCAKDWQPLTAQAGASAQGDWTLVDREGGARQWAWKGHPLYLFKGDGKPGDTTGEGHWTYIGNVGTHWEVANIVL